MGPEVYIPIDAKFWAAVAAILIPVLVNAWWISLKIISQLKVISHELEGNKEDHVEIREYAKGTNKRLESGFERIAAVNDAQWQKMVEQKVKQVEQNGRIKALEQRSGEKR